MRGTAVTYDAGESWTLIDTLGVFLINFVNDQLGWGSQYEQMLSTAMLDLGL